MLTLKRSLHGTSIQVGIEFKPQDCWVGAFWKREDLGYAFTKDLLHVWVCLIPMLPIHVLWTVKAAENKPLPKNERPWWLP